MILSSIKENDDKASYVIVTTQILCNTNEDLKGTHIQTIFNSSYFLSFLYVFRIVCINIFPLQNKKIINSINLNWIKNLRYVTHRPKKS